MSYNPGTIKRDPLPHVQTSRVELHPFQVPSSTQPLQAPGEAPPTPSPQQAPFQRTHIPPTSHTQAHTHILCHTSSSPQQVKRQAEGKGGGPHASSQERAPPPLSIAGFSASWTGSHYLQLNLHQLPQRLFLDPPQAEPQQATQESGSAGHTLTLRVQLGSGQAGRDVSPQPVPSPL